ncbi:predicted protein [Clavispora lusitaniae ATCC 42720]|uniref:Secreted protein n=1 Tax=Clavispora lusitaniae (strain ATCC 42720) TaxID=306902 RepID=C4Y550_CLAL4|nr:uncharacterized protein CLUG_03284 [Clavispora lusitaniae ATCC 42720]EEQ39156.1 predicted protein [Clavispora lusitaniae ATCC 42720]
MSLSMSWYLVVQALLSWQISQPSQPSQLHLVVQRLILGKLFPKQVVFSHQELVGALDSGVARTFLSRSRELHTEQGEFASAFARARTLRLKLRRARLELAVFRAHLAQLPHQLVGRRRQERQVPLKLLQAGHGGRVHAPVRVAPRHVVPEGKRLQGSVSGQSTTGRFFSRQPFCNQRQSCHWRPL